MVQASVSQSVERAIRVFALFAEQRRPLSRSAIVDGLDAPRSSTAALLQGMVELDILSFDRTAQTYFPTARLGRLAGWIEQMFDVDPALTALMKRLQLRTRETVTLVTPLSQTLEVVRVEPGLHEISYVAQVGQIVPLWTSAVGQAYLATETDAAIAERHRRARLVGEKAPPSLETIMDAIRQVRNDGHGLYVGSIASDAATVAAALPRGVGRQPYAIGLSGPTVRIMQGAGMLAQALAEEIGALLPRDRAAATR